MAKIAITFNANIGGSMALSIRKTFADIGSVVIDADYREIMHEFDKELFQELYNTDEGRKVRWVRQSGTKIRKNKSYSC